MRCTAPGHWLPYTTANSRVHLRLFCFPYAGGSASIFRAWSSEFPSSIQICPVELPGRGTRIREAPFTSVELLAAAAAEGLGEFLDRPFTLFGHSLGALVAFEVARRLHYDFHLQPAHLFVSARRGPRLPGPAMPIHALPERRLLEMLGLLNGTPKELLENHDFMRLILPVLRADFALDETYTYMARPPLTCPISVFGGLQDISVNSEQLSAWRKETEDRFVLRMLPGDHFILNSARALILEALAHELRLAATQSVQNYA